MFEKLNPSQIKRMAGAGNKFTYLSEGLADFYLNLVPGLKFWDMCASEALIKARYGVVSDAL